MTVVRARIERAFGCSLSRFEGRWYARFRGQVGSVYVGRTLVECVDYLGRLAKFDAERAS